MGLWAYKEEEINKNQSSYFSVISAANLRDVPSVESIHLLYFSFEISLIYNGLLASVNLVFMVSALFNDSLAPSLEQELIQTIHYLLSVASPNNCFSKDLLSSV